MRSQACCTKSVFQETSSLRHVASRTYSKRHEVSSVLHQERLPRDIKFQVRSIKNVFQETSSLKHVASRASSKRHQVSSALHQERLPRDIKSQARCIKNIFQEKSSLKHVASRTSPKCWMFDNFITPPGNPPNLHGVVNGIHESAESD